MDLNKGSHVLITMISWWAPLCWLKLKKVSNRIINEIADVSRFIYDVSYKSYATIEWE